MHAVGHCKTLRIVIGVGAILIGVGASAVAPADEPAAHRTTAGLVALYEFASPDEPVIRESGARDPRLSLSLRDPARARRSSGAIELTGDNLLRTEGPAARIAQAVRQADEITIEAWVRPARVDQRGPARIITLSVDTGSRNFTLGHDGDRYEVRLRTTATSANGNPAVSSTPGSLTDQPTHVVYTHDRSGASRIYINGELNAEQVVAGSMSNWDPSYALGLGNEMTLDRPWVGAVYLAAIYARDLLPDEVRSHFLAGPRGATGGSEASARADTLFEWRIAPILARRCLECHDSASREGELDLSRRDAALVGGKHGEAIVPGDAAASRVWERVESDEMPEGRDPLSAEEKNLLRDWIDAGAVWPMEVIDAADYALADAGPTQWIRRLTRSEYVETVRAAVGVDIAREARRLLPPDIRADGFTNTAYNLNVDLKHIEAYAELASLIVDRMDAAAFASQYTPDRRLHQEAMRPFIAQIGKRILRGPLSDQEVLVFHGISSAVASSGGGFDDAVRYILEAMLQSPRFIYRIESQRGDGTAWPAGPYELASRLSYTLWGAPPDDELMRAAMDGKLYDRRDVAAQVARMLEDPRAVSRSKEFFAEWMALSRLAYLRPNASRFAEWSPELADDMRAESLAFFEEVAWTQDRPLADLFNAKVTYATPRLAALYGLEPSGDGLRRYDLTGVAQRGGLLTQGGVLTVGGDEASMVTRGLFVLKEILRGRVDDPPPCVDTTPVPTSPGESQRTIAEARITNASCGGCHGRFEPPAFALERFNGIGAYRETDEHGNALREDGEILFPGAGEPVAYASSRDLMNLLAGSERVRQTLTWKLTQYALGRPLTVPDLPHLRRIHAEAMNNGGTYKATVTAIALSELMRYTVTEPAP